jgi:hypothetical protein
MQPASVLAALVFQLVFSGSVSAQTPDEEPPAFESACDVLNDKKAAGLCVAYCEAMDCEDRNVTADPTACDRVLENWDKTHARVEMPCLAEECTCEFIAEKNPNYVSCVPSGQSCAPDATCCLCTETTGRCYEVQHVTDIKGFCRPSSLRLVPCQ